MKVTYQLAMAAGRDAANRSMKARGASTWNQADYNLAAKIVARLMSLQS